MEENINNTYDNGNMSEKAWAGLAFLGHAAFIIGMTCLLIILAWTFFNGTEIFDQEGKKSFSNIKENWIKILLVISGIAVIFGVFIFLWSLWKFSSWYQTKSDDFYNWKLKKYRQFEDWKLSWYQGTIIRGFRTLLSAIELFINLLLFALLVSIFY